MKEYRHMQIRNILIFLLIGIAIALTIGVYMVQEDKDELQASIQCTGEIGLEVGNCAPDFMLTTIDGESLRLSESNGKPTFINFWATWCGYCRDEMPFIQKAFEQYKDQIHFYMVNATSTETSLADVKKYLDDHQYSFPVLLDPKKENQTVTFGQYEAIGLPMSFLIDREGRIVQKVGGALEEKKFIQMLKQVMK
ncbi:TlpA family protein disulfide reductase [Hazenella sp. IB182353]|uniref:TlpA family protein disulfide reductase n=1 Tax=Polycladospora coralii TaxID=2771432 RepID=UPI00174688FA|nr:TlpA disulfide reductase family protein [Polycladospora coralii]MBS7530253.1 TlpA family protein disulfide reductase [Polycladospora coralii]